MAYETVIAAFDDADAATAAIRQLRRLGVPAHEIKRHPVSSMTLEDVARAPVEPAATGFWAWLFGPDTIEARVALYRKALLEGGTVVTVRVLEETIQEVRESLDRFGPLEIEESRLET